METEEKLELIERNVAEIVAEAELRDILEKKRRPVAYCGYEPNARAFSIGKQARSN
jgi:tyrosyl-tRNA synthetase